ncbi:Na/Pi cotransporter family protein, partial [Anaerosporobacter sp.]|uniref:Na/Pi cotransporter family protein n=1 Tax=Anaerosporobacter sp. TaxID=1872529 RepID=UPI00286F2A84
MTVEVLGTIFSFIGGLGLFLYGMNVMADGLQKSAGGKMKQLMGILTHNRLLAVLVGALVTAIIQSSSATTVMVVGFVNAGIVNLTQAVGVIMGANVGTTVTGWLVSMNEWGAIFKPSFFAPLLIGIGAFATMFSKKEKKKDIAEILVGFGVLFIGLEFMSGAIKPYSDAPIFSTAFSVLGKNPILAILAGAIITAIIQSSSASVGILQTLAMNGVVTWNSAVFITLGQNIGTCVTALLSSAGANKTAKRAAVIHLLFNVIGAIIFGVLMFVIFTFKPSFAGSSINSVQISIFHTIFNIANTVILFPFANLLVKLSGLIIDDSKEQEAEEDEVKMIHLDERIFETPSFAIENVVKESINLGRLTLKNTEAAMQAILQNDVEQANEVFKTEKLIDNYEKKITEYLIKISNLSINEEQHLLVNDLFYTISNIERIGDHAENLAELAVSKIDHNIWFSDSAYKELEEICDISLQSFENAILARETENMEYVRKVVKLEDQVDILEEELR